MGPVGSGQPHENRAPYMAVTYIICMNGIFPQHPDEKTMDPYIGQISITAFDFAPRGWRCATAG